MPPAPPVAALPRSQRYGKGGSLRYQNNMRVLLVWLWACHSAATVGMHAEEDNGIGFRK